MVSVNEMRTGKPSTTHLDCLFVVITMKTPISEPQSLCPIPLVEITKHALFQFRLLVVDGDRVVMTIETVDERVNCGLVEVSDVRCRLSRLSSCHCSGRLDQAESINDDFALDGLDGVDDDGYCSRSEFFKCLLCIDIDVGKPASETRVRVIPSDDDFGSA